MKPFIFILISTFILSCSQSPKLEYKYSDKDQTIACSDKSNALLNEALYSFEADLIKYYKKGVKDNLINSYSKFIAKGMGGVAPYQDITNAHSLAIRDALLAEGINNIENPKLKKNLNVLIETNTMNPKIFNSRPRKLGRKAEKHRYNALYIALDGYYQNLVGLSLKTETSDE